MLYPGGEGQVSHCFSSGKSESSLMSGETSPIVDPTEELEGLHEWQIVAWDSSYLDSQVIAILSQLFVDGVASATCSLVTVPAIDSGESQAQAQVALSQRWHYTDVSLGCEHYLTSVVLFIQGRGQFRVAHVTYNLTQSLLCSVCWRLLGPNEEDVLEEAEVLILWHLAWSKNAAAALWVEVSAGVQVWHGGRELVLLRTRRGERGVCLSIGIEDAEERISRVDSIVHLPTYFCFTVSLVNARIKPFYSIWVLLSQVFNWESFEGIRVDHPLD